MPHKVLLVGEFFWPSLGGIEVFLGDLGQELVQAGVEVEVATSRRKERTKYEWNGMKIHEFDQWRFMDDGGTAEIARMVELIKQGNFDSVIVLSHPDNWSLNLMTMPQPRPQMIFMPIINLSNVNAWTTARQLNPIIKCLSCADSLVRITESSCDAQLLELAGIESTFIPHGIRKEAPELDFRKELEISAETPLFVMVANYWPVKNHIPLIKTLRDNLDGDWRLVIMGSPHVMSYYQEVQAAAQGEDRIIVLPRQSRETASAAIRDADALLLASEGEGCPLVILQAMSHATPWLATPQCGSVMEQAGGIAAELEQFPGILQAMMKRRKLTAQLGELGEAHWKRSFSMKRVSQGFVELIQGKQLSRDYAYAPSIRKLNQELIKTIIK